MENLHGNRQTIMDEIALFDAKNRLSELVDRVLEGETIIITRRGKAVAQLTLPQSERSHAKDAVAQLRAARKGVSLGKQKSRDLIAEGRR
jgi:antitoxin (DNA-binding transcriptional repressor) of toxin-antitoxin stability system